jgi:hypothetical protein
VVIEKSFIGNLETFTNIFDVASMPSSPEIDYLRLQKFNVTYLNPTDKLPSSKIDLFLLKLRKQS